MDHLNAPHFQLAGGSTNAIGLVINASNPLASNFGGTGISNSAANTITLGGSINVANSFTTSGANPLTLTTTGSTNVTLPTTGTLVNTAVTTLSSLSSIGTITTGTWNGSVIGGTYGGTGINNGSSTFTMGGSVSFSGAFTFSGTLTGTTAITFPTSGTLATVGSNGVSITSVTTTSFTMTATAAVNIFVVNNASLVTVTLPATFSIGQQFIIIGAGAGGWKVAQNAGQSISYQSGATTTATTVGTGGSLSSTLFNDCATFSGTVANTTLTLSSAYANNLVGV